MSKYFTSLSGVVDGLRFVETAHGTVMSSTPKRTPRKRTPAQLAQEERIRRTARGWGTLPKASVAAWEAFSGSQSHIDAWGNPFTPNGYQCYSALSTLWYAVNGTTNPAPANPPTVAFAVPPTFSLTASIVGNAVDFVSSDGAGDHNVVELGIQPLRNANRRPAKGGYRVAEFATFVNAGAEVGVPVSHGVFCARYRVVNKLTGERSEYVEIPVAGVALSLEAGGAPEAAKPAARKKAA